jgi:glycosyltransferase involved in cell wall biosynthesis
MNKKSDNSEQYQFQCSVVIPTKNRYHFLKDCLKSIMQQEKSNVSTEIIVVDDHSDDDICDLVYSEFPAFPFPLRCIKNVSFGPAAARNTGWRSAKSKYIVFLDDDCIVSKQWLNELVYELKKLPENYVGIGGRILGYGKNFFGDYIDYTGAMCHPGPLDRAAYLVTCNAVYLRIVLVEVGGFNENFPLAGGEDPELSTRIIHKGYMLGKTNNASVYHRHPKSIIAVYRMFWRHGFGRNLYEEYHGINGEHWGSWCFLVRGARNCYKRLKNTRCITNKRKIAYYVLELVRTFAYQIGYKYANKVSFKRAFKA